MPQPRSVVTRAQKQAIDAKMAHARTMKDVHRFTRADMTRAAAETAAAEALDELAAGIAESMPLLTPEQRATIAAVFASAPDAEGTA